jgi:hypothetical protein
LDVCGWYGIQHLGRGSLGSQITELRTFRDQAQGEWRFLILRLNLTYIEEHSSIREENRTWGPSACQN